MSLSWEMCQAVMVIYTFVFGMIGPLKVRTLPKKSFDTYLSLEGIGKLHNTKTYNFLEREGC